MTLRCDAVIGRMRGGGWWWVDIGCWRLGLAVGVGGGVWNWWWGLARNVVGGVGGGFGESGQLPLREPCICF